MITLDFEKRGQIGLCDYIYESIKSQIINGSLKANKKLPSKRTFAEHLGVSIITVQNAYAELIAEGYIYSIEKKGFFVMDLPKVSKSQKQNTNENIKIELPANKQVYFTDFQSNSVGYEKFPFTLWAHVTRSVLNRADEKLLEREDAFGTLELRKSIAKYLCDFRNINVQAEQIVIGAGTENLYTMLVQLLGRDKTYAVENPGFHKVASVIELNGAKFIPIDIDKSGINPIELTKTNADIVHVSPAHHFPTGIVMPVKRRRELLSWAYEKQGRFIIEDDYDSEFRFNGKPLQTLQSADEQNRVIYMNTFSKTLAPAFRISFMVLPIPLINDFIKKFSFYSCPVSTIDQFTLAEFINQGHYEKHISRMKNYYRSLRNNLISALQGSKLSKIATIQEEEAGLHFLLSIHSTKSEEELKENLLAQSINIPLLKDFYYSDYVCDVDSKSHIDSESSCNTAENSIFEQTIIKKQKTFIINYSGIKKERISETVKRIETALLTTQ